MDVFSLIRNNYFNDSFFQQVDVVGNIAPFYDSRSRIVLGLPHQVHEFLNHLVIQVPKVGHIPNHKLPEPHVKIVVVRNGSFKIQENGWKFFLGSLEVLLGNCCESAVVLGFDVGSSLHSCDESDFTKVVSFVELADEFFCVVDFDSQHY